MKQRSKVIATSIATIAMCASLAVGGTYALFTSESEVNIAVTAGTVDVRAKASELTLFSKGVEQAGNTFEVGGTATKEDNKITIDRMVPMDSLKFDIAIENYSDVNVQYRTVISVVEDTGLFSALTVTFTENGTAQVFNGGYAYADWKPLEASDNDPTTKDDVKTINVEIAFPDGEDQNVYQGKSCEIMVTVEAVQGNAEVVNPVTQTGERSWDVNNEEGMMLMNGIINGTSHGEGKSINFTLTDDMDMTGYAWTPIHAWWVNVDGQNHTVSNLNAGITDWGRSGFIGYVGGSTVKNITLKNVTAVGSQAGVVAGSLEGATLENVTIAGTNSVTYDYNANPVETWGGVGAVAGVSTSVKTSTVTIAEGATVIVDYNGIISESPYYNKYSQLQDISEYVTDNGTVTEKGDWLKPVTDGVGLMPDGTYGVYNAAGLNYINGIISTKVQNVKLLADIDMSDYVWKTVDIKDGGKLATFDGNNKTISNMTVEGKAMFGMIIGQNEVTIKDLTFDNATVDASALDPNAALIAVTVWKNTTLDNVDVENSKISGETKVATLVGTVADDGASAVITLTVKNCDIENVTVTGYPKDKTEERLAGMVAWVADKFNNDTIVLENNTMTNVSIVSNSEAEEHHAIIYISDVSKESRYGVYHNEDAGVTVTDCKYVRAFVAASQDSLNSAISASTNVNVTLSEGTYSMPSASGKDIAISGTKDTVITVDKPNLSGSDVRFDGVTIQGSGDYTGVQHVNTVTYNNATIVGVTFLYGKKVVFNNCTFELVAEQYIWTYGATEVEFNNCTFNSQGKALLVYGDSPNDLSTTSTVYVNDCKFYAKSAVEGKAAIEIDSRFINMVVYINNTTSEGFDNGNISGNSLWNNKKGNAAKVTVDGVQMTLNTAPNT